MSDVRLSDRERQALLGMYYGGGEYFFSFNDIAAMSGLDRAYVRRSVRSLKRKGLATFRIGLTSDDGEMRGSGYALNAAGIALGDKLDPDQ